MSKTKIFSALFGIIALFLAWYLYYSINSSIVESQRIEKMEARIIEQLKMIREAEIAYLSVNGQYTSDWDKLLAFVDTGSFYITEREEFIKTLAYGADSSWVEIDTLGTVPVKDSVFNKSRWPRFDLASLPLVPGVEPATKFLIWADKIDKSGVKVNAIEVVNPKPINPERDEESEYQTRKPLRFGSRTSVTTAGNWE